MSGYCVTSICARADTRISLVHLQSLVLSPAIIFRRLPTCVTRREKYLENVASGKALNIWQTDVQTDRQTARDGARESGTLRHTLSPGSEVGTTGRMSVAGIILNAPEINLQTQY